MCANGINIRNSGKISAYKSQLCIYNNALSMIQGYKPTQAYLLGRRWEYTTKGQYYYNNSCLDRLGVIDLKVLINHISIQPKRYKMV